ncbi:MAG: NAD(P)/FAD-dependent oxidoreductase [Intestinibacter bartlettii]|uniref:NAD(P)/FAD-dependent oxidoreductase n=1 Tax=Intestinibacter bartlettii TaxID=261299 RepID=UPI00242C3AA3|nr:FAD-dependent oxidoreductase [Intestinibacter bartlettii]MBS7147264.1 FAD-binding oxidoreductase [Intestinibacter bartlettii]
MVGLNIPIKPRKGQLIISEPIGPFMEATVQCARYNIIKFNPESIKDKNVLKLGSSLSIEQTKEGTLVIGEVDKIKGFYIAAGHEGDGIALAPISGKLLAELITDGKPSYNIDHFTPNRFEL